VDLFLIVFFVLVSSNSDSLIVYKLPAFFGALLNTIPSFKVVEIGELYILILSLFILLFLTLTGFFYTFYSVLKYEVNLFIASFISSINIYLSLPVNSSSPKSESDDEL
jgi:hypothetical protein